MLSFSVSIPVCSWFAIQNYHHLNSVIFQGRWKPLTNAIYFLRSQPVLSNSDNNFIKQHFPADILLLNFSAVMYLWIIELLLTSSSSRGLSFILHILHIYAWYAYLNLQPVFRYNFLMLFELNFFFFFFFTGWVVFIILLSKSFVFSSIACQELFIIHNLYFSSCFDNGM